jgi:hypothetical protein
MRKDKPSKTSPALRHADVRLDIEETTPTSDSQSKRDRNQHAIAQRRRLGERVWFLVGIISAALSNHPMIRADRVSRRLTDRARKALTDLYDRLDGDVRAIEVDSQENRRPSGGRRK